MTITGPIDARPANGLTVDFVVESDSLVASRGCGRRCVRVYYIFSPLSCRAIRTPTCASKKSGAACKFTFEVAMLRTSTRSFHNVNSAS